MATVRKIHPRVGTAKGRVARLEQIGAAPERIEAARAELHEAMAESAVQKIVDAWPPLSVEQRAKLAVILLAPAGNGNAA